MGQPYLCLLLCSTWTHYEEHVHITSQHLRSCQQQAQLSRPNISTLLLSCS